jgi:Right handed beta helix region
MKQYSESRVGPRFSPLVAAMIAASASFSATAAVPEPLSVTMSASWHPGAGSGVAALMQALRARSARSGAAVSSGIATHVVSSCADDGGSGTLRAAIDAANSGDLVELGGLQCSAITLTQGAIPVKVDDLTVNGGGAQKLAIDGAAQDRVFAHYGYGTLTLANVTVRNGLNQLSGYKVAGGACIIANGYITLDHSVVSGCRSIGEGAYGGGILARGVTLYTSKLVDNIAQGSLLKTLTAAYGGGAFAYRGVFSMYTSVVSGNRATIDPANVYGSYDTGGGIFADDGGIAVGSTVVGNYTDGTGGGIASHAGFVVNNSTISGNTAKSKAGGGIFVRPVYPVSISNSTIARNQAKVGGGLYIAGQAQPVTLQSTIIGENTASVSAADIGAQTALTILGANSLVVGTSAGITLPGDTLHSAPLLQPLAQNGGSTATHALAAGSPAIDHGNNAANLTTDQRGTGFPRVLGRAADIGAFETIAAAVAAVPEAAPALSSGMLALLAAVLGWFGSRRSRMPKS